MIDILDDVKCFVADSTINSFDFYLSLQIIQYQLTYTILCAEIISGNVELFMC